MEVRVTSAPNPVTEPDFTTPDAAGGAEDREVKTSQVDVEGGVAVPLEDNFNAVSMASKRSRRRTKPTKY